MAKKEPGLYSVSKTFVWFAIVSVVLTASLVGIVITDHSREWKVWQKKFIRLKAEKTRQELRAADEKIDKQKLEILQTQAAEAADAFRKHRKEYAAAQSAAGALAAKVAKAGAETQNLKQFQDSARYFYEETRAHRDPRAAKYGAELEILGPRLAQAKQNLEALEKEKDEKDAVLQSFVAKEKTLRKEIDKLLEEKTRIEKRLEKLKPSLAQEILNAPMLDFIAPSLKIQQTVLDNLYDDYHFTKVQKVDRCTTCHLAIDQSGFEDAPQPFRTHPKLELYLSSSSKHPIEKFGCTVCHGGSGHSVSFKDSAHTPKNQEQAKEWHRKYRWEELEKWDAKMLPSNHIQASCAKCHRDVVEIPQADQLNRGRKLAETHGCFNCHKVAGFSDAEHGGWKAGPDLEHVQSKLTKDWLVRWLEDPRSFRDSTKMPRFFHLSNNTAPEDADKDNATIAAIAEYLMKNSKPVELSKPPMTGNAAQGEKLIKELGCLGCHSMASRKAGDHGPELTGLGSKTSPEWLYTWLKNPKHYSPNTRMPSLRLTDREAADITAYLLSLKNPDFDSQPVPAVKTPVVDGMILDLLQSTLRRSEAEARISQMTPGEKMQFLGQKSIAHQGCFACHAIKGFEDSKPIGAELSNEGQKDVHQFDFGLTDVERTRQAFIIQKLRDPRLFDHGKVKAYYEKLRMPQFNFTEEQIDDLTTFVLSLTQEQIPLEMQRRLDPEEVEAENGRRLIAKFNCAGCHTLDGKTGVLRELAEDPGAAPPILDGEGAKVQEKWLHEFLAHPTVIRPWLRVRMPTFDFDDEELAVLVHFFDHLSHEEISYKGLEVPQTTAEKLETGKTLLEKFQCAKCHQVNAESTALGSSFLAPDLTLTKKRLKPGWVKDWIADPQKLQEGTMMPTFFADGQTPLPDILGGDAEKQIEAIRDYLYVYETAPDKSQKNS